MQLEDAKSVNVPCKRKLSPEEDQIALSPGDATKFRSLAARCNYLSPDRPDIQFATKEVCRAMMTPNVSDWSKLKKLIRYLKGRPRLVLNFNWTEVDVNLLCFSDSDWAGCQKTRTSTSGGLIT